MKPETELRELRELDCFCVQEVLKLRHVPTVFEIVAGTFSYQKYGEGKGTVFVHHYGNHIKEFKPTTNPADAMEVLERCREKSQSAIAIGGKGRDDYIVGEAYVGPNGIVARADTLPLAIAKFARQIFSA